MESNKTAGIVAAVLAIAVVAGGIFWFVNRDDGSDTSDASQNTSQQAVTIFLIVFAIRLDDRRIDNKTCPSIQAFLCNH